MVVSVLSEEVAEEAVSSAELLSGAAEVLSVLTVAEDDEVVFSAVDCDEFADEEQPVRQRAATRAAVMSFTFMMNFLSGLFFILSYPFNVNYIDYKTDDDCNGKHNDPYKIIILRRFVLLRNIACHRSVICRCGVGLRCACRG